MKMALEEEHEVENLSPVSITRKTTSVEIATFVKSLSKYGPLYPGLNQNLFVHHTMINSNFERQRHCF